MASFGERVVGAMRLDSNTFEEIERDPTAMGQAVGVIALAAVSTGSVPENGMPSPWPSLATSTVPVWSNATA